MTNRTPYPVLQVLQKQHGVRNHVMRAGEDVVLVWTCHRQMLGAAFHHVACLLLEDFLITGQNRHGVVVALNWTDNMQAAVILHHESTANQLQS